MDSRTLSEPLWTARFYALVLICSGWFSAPVWAAEQRTGQQIYEAQCATCHGARGEGTEEQYPAPLQGDRPVADLAELISETMPADDPEQCVGEDAEKVAAYIYDAFYSEAARMQQEKPRIELARLTVRQYHNTIADLIGSFSDRQAEWNDERGLEGEYYNSKRARRNRRVIERRDATVNFDFGKSSPEPEKIEVEEFSITWEGSVLAPDTGDYEFVIKTENAARLWINDQDRPLIDAGVKSGQEREYRQSIHLLGGRAYPLRLEYFKAKEDSANTEGTASIALHWKPPHQVEQLVPERYLSPHRFPELLVLETPFPPDDRSVGYERGSSVSKAWDEATTYAAIEIAGYVMANLEELADSDQDDDDREKKLRAFCHRFVERAFRRPLTEEQARLYVDQHFEDTPLNTAVKRVVLLTLKSPRFLYRELSGPELDHYDVASRLSYGLWDSLPDQSLLEAAGQSQLDSPAQVAQHAERMLSDLRARAKVREFLHGWLNLEHMHDISKDSELFPNFDEHLVSDLRASLDLFLDDVVWSDSSDFRQLLLADYLYVNGRLAKIYDIDLPEDAEFQKVTQDATKRAGVLAHPFLLSGFAYHSTSSPIHRGVFIVRSVLGRSLRPPPEAFTPLSPDLHPDLTTRQRTELQTSEESCMMCHGLINPMGFSLEHYDAIGRYRTEEQGKPIEADGFYKTLSGDQAEFTGVRELALFLAGTPETHTAFVKQLFHHLVKQPITAFGTEKPEDLRKKFVENDFNIKKLLVDVMTASALTPIEPQEGKAA